MNKPATITNSIPDTQGSEDTRRIAIDRVGIKDIKHPVVVRDRAGREQHTVANFNMYVGLPHMFKGTHMSRFVEILNHHEYEISVPTFEAMVGEMTKLLDLGEGRRSLHHALPVLEEHLRLRRSQSALTRNTAGEGSGFHLD